MENKTLQSLLSGAWKDELKRLPKYQKRELNKVIKVNQQIDNFKYGIITFVELKRRLRKLFKGIN